VTPLAVRSRLSLMLASVTLENRKTTLRHAVVSFFSLYILLRSSLSLSLLFRFEISEFNLPSVLLSRFICEVSRNVFLI